MQLSRSATLNLLESHRESTLCKQHCKPGQLTDQGKRGCSSFAGGASYIGLCHGIACRTGESKDSFPEETPNLKENIVPEMPGEQGENCR